jgi:His/Glu/Gln/Arg/opine family amino acid ABC transporter permease subunit
MNWAVVIDNAHIFVRGTAATIVLVVITLSLSVALAVPLAVLRDSHWRPLAMAVAGFSWFMRAVPALTLLFFAYYGLPSFGIYLESLPSAVIGLTLSAAGYNLEYIRAGLRSVPRNQYDAARALGIPFVRAFHRIILPQAMRVIVPPLTSNLTLLLKGSALASLVAVSELTGEAMALISFSFQPIEVLIVTALIYLALNSLLVGFQGWAEYRFRAERLA